MSVLWPVLGLLCVSTFARGQVDQCYFCYDTDSSCEDGTALAKQTCYYELGISHQEAKPEKSSASSHSSSGSEISGNYGGTSNGNNGQFSCVKADIYDSFHNVYLTKRSCVYGTSQDYSCSWLANNLRHTYKKLLNCTTCLGDLCNSSGVIRSSLLISGVVMIFIYFFK